MENNKWVKVHNIRRKFQVDIKVLSISYLLMNMMSFQGTLARAMSVRQLVKVFVVLRKFLTYECIIKKPMRLCAVCISKLLHVLSFSSDKYRLLNLFVKMASCN